MTRAKQRIAVAMSGGVDSSVAAALLKKAGQSVIGFFVRTWTPQAGDGTVCTWVEERRDALRVAARLNIPLITLDLESVYRRDVVGPLVAGYAAGETPNPDVLCNRVVKFAALWDAARRYGATQLATGHYVRRLPTPAGPAIGRAADRNKDQSYFLWDIRPDMVPLIRFPLGELTKPRVRQLAAEFGLPVAAKKDSQGICFLGPTDIQRFLDGYLGQQPGPIRDLATGRVVGRHTGIHHATIGQRHHIGQLVSPTADPVFVVRIDPVTQTLWVGERSALYQTEVTIRDPNWLASDWEQARTAGRPLVVAARVRYRQAPTRARVMSVAGRLVVRFDEPVYAPAPGQSLVFYAGNRLLGGGIIETILSASRAGRQNSTIKS